MAKNNRIRFLQTGDLHIGRGRLVLGEKASLERGGRLLDAIYRIALDNDCQGILITGDVFDTKDVTNGERELVAAKLSAFAGRKITGGIPTYVIAGNHDQTGKSAGNLDYLAEISATGEIENLHVSFATREDIWDGPVPGLKIIGAPCAKSEDQRWIEGYVKTLPTDEQFIFMGHGTIRGCVRNDQGWKPSDAEDSKKLSLHAAALSAPQIIWWAYGDIHKSQKLPSLPDTANGCYAGSPIQMDFGETENRGVTIVAFDKEDTGWKYVGKRYVRVDTPERGFAPFVVVKSEDELESVPANALIKIDKKVVLSSEKKSRVVRTFKVLEDMSLPEVPEGLVAATTNGTTLEAVDPLLSNIQDIERDVLGGFKPSSDDVEDEAKRVVRAAVARFQDRTYLS